MYMLFDYAIVLDGLPGVREFHFFLGSGRPQTRLSSNVVFIFQKHLNVWKDISLEAKHVGTHLIDQLKKKCAIWRQRLFHCFVCLCICISFWSITPLCPYFECSNPIMIIFSVDGHTHCFPRSIRSLGI